MAALTHHRAVAVRDGRLQLRRADRGHQHVVGGTNDLDRAADACGVAAEVGLFQGAEPVQQVGFALEMGQRQRFFGLQTGGASGHPVCRVEKQRLRLNPRLRAAGMQQALADLKAAAGVGVKGQPAVDAHQRGQGVGMIQRQLQADQRPQRMAHDAIMANPGIRQRPVELVRHLGKAVALRQGVGVIARSPLVITDHLILLLQRGQLGQPVAAAAAETGNKDHHGRTLIRGR